MYMAHLQPERDFERGSSPLSGMKLSKGLPKSTSPPDLLKTSLKQPLSPSLLMELERSRNKGGGGSAEEWTFPLQKHQQHLHWRITWAVLWSWGQSRAEQLKSLKHGVCIKRSAISCPWPIPSPVLAMGTARENICVSAKTAPWTVPTSWAAKLLWAMLSCSRTWQLRCAPELLLYAFSAEPS